METDSSFAGALKGLGLIPRTPLPSLSPQPEAVDDEDRVNRGSVKEMTREELEAEVLRLRKSQTKVKVEKVAVKRERSESESAGPSTLALKKTKKPKVLVPRW
jgi:hypothetical protein